MPSPLRTPKTLSDWIELDYFKRPRPFRWMWKWVLGGTLLVAVLAVAATFLPGKQVVYEAGPVSTAHALFNNDCGRCHTGSFQPVNRFVHADAAVRSVPDSACTQCHSGPPHHEQYAEQHNCATCHREHQGRQMLARVPDSTCTECHANLKRKDGSASPFAEHVTGFGPGQHPEFHLWADPKDPGTILFNHKAHLPPGGGLLDVDRRQLEMQARKIRELKGEPCREFLERKPVKMHCESCHQPDEAGRYMGPIKYDNQCKQCHPLSVQLIGRWPDPRLQALACRFSVEEAPHPKSGETAAAVRAALRDRLVQFIQTNPGLAREEVAVEPERPIPGVAHAPPLNREEYAWVNRQLESMERLLFDGGGGCRRCHTEETAPDKRPNGLPQYKPMVLPPTRTGEARPEKPPAPGIPGHWFEHGLFGHRSHRMLECRDCHAGKAETETAGDVTLPRIKTCQQCHAPQGGAPSACAECHVYHDRARDTFHGHQTVGDLTHK